MCDFWVQTLLIPPGQNVLILLINNMYNGNIRSSWYRKLCMKTWYSSKFLHIGDFYCDFLGPHCAVTSNLHTTKVFRITTIDLYR